MQQRILELTVATASVQLLHVNICCMLDVCVCACVCVCMCVCPLESMCVDLRGAGMPTRVCKYGPDSLASLSSDLLSFGMPIMPCPGLVVCF